MKKESVLLASLFAALASVCSFAQSPYWGAPFQLPGRIQAEDYDNGGEGVAYHDTTPGNVFGVYRFDDVDVGAIPADSGGGYHIGFLADGEWTTYTVSVPTTQNYQLQIRAASGYPGPNIFHVELNGVDVTGPQTVPATGDWQTYQILTLPAVRLSAGANQILRVSFDTGAWNFDYLDVLASQPFYGSPASLPGHIEAEDYDVGGEGIAWHDTTPGNIFGAYRFDDVDVGPIPAGGYFVGYLADGEWVNYTVNIAATQNYELHVRYASAYPFTSYFHVELDGQDITGVQTITSTGDWQNYTLKIIPLGVQQVGNNRVLRFVFDAGAWNFDGFEWVPQSCTPPTITQQPADIHANPHDNVNFSAIASGSPAPSLQWLQNGVVIPGATTPTLRLTNVREDAIGSYQLVATNSCGQALSNPAALTVECNGSPDLETESLFEALHGRPAVCNWRADYEPGFPNSLGGGSFNRPVLAAAIGLVKNANLPGPDPQYPGVAGWWRKYLKGEVGDRGNQWYYGGTEPFSYIYEQYNIAAVLAVHYRAQQLGLSDLEDLARRWLRATFALQAAAAMPPVRSFWDRGIVCLAPGSYNGPYLPMAGMRSAWVFWGSPNRNVFYAHAVGEAGNDAGEDRNQNGVRRFLEANWNGSNGDVYGLLASEKSGLRAIRTTGQLPSIFNSMISGIKMLVPYHIVAWPGVRVTLMESNQNGNTAPTYGVAYFTAPRVADGNEAHFLFPWTRSDEPTDHCLSNGGRPWRHDITAGSGTLNLASHYVEATNYPGNSTHPLTTVRIDNLPAAPPQYHIVIGP